MSSPCVHSFMGSNVDSSSFSVISVNTIGIKMHNWVVSLVSVDSSNYGEKHSRPAKSLQSCVVKSLAITSQRCVTGLFDSWRALIDDNISGLFLKSRNKKSAASAKASSIISPSWKDFLCLMIEGLTLLVNSAVWKTTVVQLSDFSSLNFFLSRLAFWKDIRVVLFMNSLKVPLNTPSLWNSDGSATNQTNTLRKKSPPTIPFFNWSSCPTHFLYPFFCWYQLKPLTRSLSSRVFCSS